MKTIKGWTGIFLHKIEQGYSFQEACVLTKIGKGQVMQECKTDLEFNEKLETLLANTMNKKVQWNG